MFKPEFPTHNYLELQRSKIQIGDKRSLSWETTYNSSMKPLQRDSQTTKVDTVMLQKTHWTPGNIPMTTESESHEKFRPYTVSGQREKPITRDEMMKTTFNIADPNSSFEQRSSARVITRSPKYENYRDKMIETHFSLKNPDAPKWQTTSKEAYPAYDSKPAEAIRNPPNIGLGAKETMNLSNFPLPNTSNHDAFAYAKQVTAKETRPDTGVKWQKTNFKLGGVPTNYQTTMHDQFPPDIETTKIDSEIAQKRRQALTKSSISNGNVYPTVKSSTMHDSMSAHPEYRPPPKIDPSLYTSHHDIRNSDERPTTTMKDSYKPIVGKPEKPVNLALQSSHVQITSDGVHEVHSLYNDTYTKPPPTYQPVDAQLMRTFHTSHHSRIGIGAEAKTGQSTNHTSYIAHPGFKPPEMCKDLKGGHNVVPNENRFAKSQSCMKDAYQVPKKVEQPSVRDNSLQQSHIQLKSNSESWSTTQGDYFKFKTYNISNKH